MVEFVFFGVVSDNAKKGLQEKFGIFFGASTVAGDNTEKGPF